VPRIRISDNLPLKDFQQEIEKQITRKKRRNRRLNNARNVNLLPKGSIDYRCTIEPNMLPQTE
jgi:hypothetical protein